MLGDRLGERWVIWIALAGTLLGSALLAVTATFAAFELFARVLGAGTGLYYALAASWLTRRYENTGSVLGVHTEGGPLARLVAPRHWVRARGGRDRAVLAA